MISSNKALSDFVDEIDFVTDIDTLFSALEKAALALGFDSISYSYVPAVIGSALQQFSPVFKISKSYNTKFIEHYARENFAGQDFTIRRIKSGDLTPMNWWQEAERKAISRKEKEVIAVARSDYGMRHGISIPTYSDGYSIAGVSLTSSDSDHQFSLLYSERLNTTRQIAHIFSDRVLVRADIRAYFFLPLLEKMSKTEKLILKNLALGKALKAISAEIGVSYKHAGNVVEHLRAKFGGISREQLLYLAGTIEFHKLIP